MQKGSPVWGDSFSELCLPQPCPAQDTLGECFSLLKGPRADIQPTARNVLLCQEKPAGSKLPSVLFLEVNVIVLSFLTGFARCYVPCNPCWSRRSTEEASSLTLGFELTLLLPHCGFPVGFIPGTRWAVMCVQHWSAALALEDAHGLWGRTFMWCLHGVGSLKGAPSSGHVSSFPFHSFCERPWREERIQAASQDSQTPPNSVKLESLFQPKIQEGEYQGVSVITLELNCSEMCSPKYV